MAAPADRADRRYVDLGANKRSALWVSRESPVTLRVNAATTALLARVSAVLRNWRGVASNRQWRSAAVGGEEATAARPLSKGTHFAEGDQRLGIKLHEHLPSITVQTHVSFGRDSGLTAPDI